MSRFAFRAWDTEEKRFHFFSGIFNRKPYIETSTFVQYESCPKDNNIADIEQWTGLKDRNGRDIYEGDIVKIDGWEKHTYTVAFGGIGYDGEHNGLTGFYYKETAKYDNYMELIFEHNPKIIEVIGNIHEEAKTC